MPLMNRVISNLFGGVSQQPAGVRLDNQCEEMINAYPSISDGLVKRPPTEFISLVVPDASLGTLPENPPPVTPEDPPPTMNYSIYAVVFGEDIYVQTTAGGVDGFAPLGQAFRDWTGVTAAPNGDVYACAFAGDIYKQTNGAGDFLPLGQVSRNWIGMGASPNGDVYACVYGGGDIYKQTAGEGAFVEQGHVGFDWRGITFDADSALYSCMYQGNIWKGFVDLGPQAVPPEEYYWTDMAALNSDIYACTDAGEVCVQTGGSGPFVVISTGESLGFHGITLAPNGDIYVAASTSPVANPFGKIYKISSGDNTLTPVTTLDRQWYQMTTRVFETH